MPVFFSKDELNRFGEELEKFRGELFKRKYLSEVKPFPKVRELFERIVQDGRRIALASSAKAEEVEHYKKLLHIEDLLKAQTSSDDAERSKPHPDIFQAALKRLGTNASTSVVIGDSPFDAEAAGKLGLATIGVLCGGFPETGLRSAGCSENLPGSRRPA